MYTVYEFCEIHRSTHKYSTGMSREFSRRQFIKGMATMVGSGLGGGLTGVGIYDFLESKHLKRQAELIEKAGHESKARDLQRQSDKLSTRAKIVGLPKAAILFASMRVVLKELE